MAASKTAGLSKKEFRKSLETKMEQAISSIVDTKDKKFHKLLKKATRVLADGMHTKPVKKRVKRAPAKKAAAKKS